MAKKKKYASPKSFEEAIEFYFNSICTEETVTSKRWEKTDDGRWVEQEAPVEDKNGRPLTRVVYVTPPTVGGLCLYLGISRSAFSDYGRRRGYAEAVENARARILAYLEEKISDPDVRNVKGVTQAMEMLMRAIEEESGRQVRPLTTEERTALLQSAINCGFIGGDDGGAE